MSVISEQATYLDTEVLVIGAGGAGMYAALAAADRGARVLLVDRNMIGRGGATIMAQMTVAAALGAECPDHWQDHLADTIEAGRGLCVEPLAERLCHDAPQRMREMDEWGVGWARSGETIRQVAAPGHGVPRCCYVDFLRTGPAVAGTLRRKVTREQNITCVSDLVITDLVIDEGTCIGAAGRLSNGTHALVAARAVVIATGGLTKLYQRSSASTNMAGDGYALAARAGAELIDMEFVQFFPIGHLAPRLVGMDPIMWDPFRYKLGGRLLNGEHEEFIERYGAQDSGRYTATRDIATYAIAREVQAGRGSPRGGAYLSFTHLSQRELRAAFGPVIDRLAENGIHLDARPVEVAPIAHYHMGGVRVNAAMSTCVDGLLAAGEAVGGAGGANRLSGNAITEALVFGHLAGGHAADFALRHRGKAKPNARALASVVFAASPEPAPGSGSSEARPAVQMQAELRQLMWDDVGPFRDQTGLERAKTKLAALRSELAELPVPCDEVFSNELFDWYEMRSSLIAADAVTSAALARTESRGAHQREDWPMQRTEWEHNQILSWRDNHFTMRCSAGSGRGRAR